MPYRFSHIPVTDEAGNTRNWEQLQALLNGQLLEEYLSAAVQAKLNPGAWTALTLGAKVEEAAAPQTVRARTEQGKTSVRLRGAPLVKAGEKLKPGETLATLPEGFRPLKSVRLTTNANAAGAISANELVVATTGVMTLQVELNAGAFIMFDGQTFNLT